MKRKIIAVSIVLGLMLMTVGFAVAGKNEDTSERYLILSNNGILKMMYGVHHNFDSGFTTDLSSGQLRVLEKFGVEVEEVQIYSIAERPDCGDGICHPSEPLKCPQDCKEPEPTECYPNVQTPWGIEKVNGGNIGDGAGITVAVLDTGIDTNHIDLADNIIDCFGSGYATCEDDNGHGTHVSGTIAANGGSDGFGIFGVAPEAQIMAIKVLDSKGRGYTDDIAKGIDYAVINEANIISMSLGGGESSLITNAVARAVEAGVLVIASAGNSGPLEDSIIYPAANINVVAVAAFNESDNIASFSSRGINDDDWTIEEREIEFAAPGVSIESTWKGGCYNTISGTSMAAPHITGIAARDWKNTADATRIYLQDLAEAGYDYGLGGDDIEAGFGLPITLPTI